MECGNCTLCCKLLPVEWMDSLPGKYCKECDPDKGCKIYNNIPSKCVDFKCAYNQLTGSPIELRPDKCGVVFERIFEVFIGTIDPDIDDISDHAKGQIDSFIKEGFPVVLFKGNEKPSICPTKTITTQQAWDVIKRERVRRHGSSNL